MLMFLPSIKPASASPCRKVASAPGRFALEVLRRTPITCCGSFARAAELQAAMLPRSMMTFRRLVCRERSKLRGDGGRFTRSLPSRLEACSRLGLQTANELGAPVVSSKPEQLPGHEPASARKGYEDGDAFVLRN